MTSRFLPDCSALCCKSAVEDDTSTAVEAAPATPSPKQPTQPPRRSRPAKPPPGIPSRPSSVDRAGKTATSMNLCLEKNRTKHHTDEYEVKDLIIRRGQEFDMVIQLNEDLDEATDKIRLSFAIGKRPQRSKNTLIKVDVVDELQPSEWGAIIERKNELKVHMKVMSSAEAIIGQYTAYVEVLRKDSSGTARGYKHAKHPRPMYILFNPWCKEDSVYIEDDRHRFEYVLNDMGRIFKGNRYSITGKAWHFGQFKKCAFYAALHLLEKSALKTAACGNVILVTRMLTAMANSFDNDGGMMTGNWTGHYHGGQAPTVWNGSVAILDEYMRTGQTVKFAQCWVFSGLLTTLGRTLGIPMRSVTNFESAHDHDMSMTIDTHVDETGRPLLDLDDAIWNFHVWNEAWFRRVDLPPGNDGWQALDATPQEESNGVMRCGPAPVNAIREGNVFLNYDTKFLFAEVNADKVMWRVDAAGEMSAVGVDKKVVGESISTKAVGSNQRHDVTGNYKYPEGSEQERAVVERVARHSTRHEGLKMLYCLKEPDVNMQFGGDIKPNGDVFVHLVAANKSSAARSVEVMFFASAKYYTGVPGDDLGENTVNLSIQPNQEKTAEWLFKSSFFLHKLDEDATVAVHVTAIVMQTDQIFTSIETFWAEKPDLDLEVTQRRIQVGSTFKLKMTFKNPLDEPITNGAFHVESAGILKEVKVTYHRSIRPQETAEQIVTLTAAHPGHREIIASFYSKKLNGIEGAIHVDIYK